MGMVPIEMKVYVPVSTALLGGNSRAEVPVQVEVIPDNAAPPVSYGKSHKTGIKVAVTGR